MKRRNIIGLILGCFMAFTCVACSNSSNAESDSNISNSGDYVSKEISYAKDKDGTDLMLVEAQTSKYTIVYPENPSVYEITAVGELQTFISQSTSCNLPAVTDNGITYNEDCYYISIGDTSIFKGSGIVMSEAELGERGCRIVVRGRQILLNGLSEEGKLNSVYKFLAEEIDFEAFAVDEVYYRETYNVQVKNLDMKYKFATGASCYTELGSMGAGNGIPTARMFMYPSGSGGYKLDGLVFGGGFFMSMLHYCLPESVYNNEAVPETYHPEWFNNGQPCLTNQELTREFAKNLYEDYLLKEDTYYWLFCGSDNTGLCSCGNCSAMRAEAGGGGIMVTFMNGLDNYIQDRLQQEGVEREYCLVGLGYYAYDAPPTVANGDGTYSLVHEKYRANENVGIMYTPIQACYSHALNEKDCQSNSSLMNKLLGWKECVGENLMVHLYGTNFSHYFLYLNDFNSLYQNAQILKDVGVKYIYSQGNNYNTNSPLVQYRLYLMSKLWDNPNQDMDELTIKFFKQYYKEVWEECYGFYNEMRNYFLIAAKEHGSECNYIYSNRINWSDKKYWPQELMIKYYEKYFEPALKIVASYYSGEEYKKMYQRVLALEIPIRYILLTNYKTYYADYDKEYAQFLADCKLLGITKASETGSPLY